MVMLSQRGCRVPSSDGYIIMYYIVVPGDGVNQCDVMREAEHGHTVQGGQQREGD